MSNQEGTKPEDLIAKQVNSYAQQLKTVPLWSTFYTLYLEDMRISDNNSEQEIEAKWTQVIDRVYSAGVSYTHPLKGYISVGYILKVIGDIADAPVVLEASYKNLDNFLSSMVAQRTEWLQGGHDVQYFDAQLRQAKIQFQLMKAMFPDVLPEWQESIASTYADTLEQI